MPGWLCCGDDSFVLLLAALKVGCVRIGIATLAFRTVGISHGIYREIS
jgi:hypothetical protein